ncbi:MAG TPA: sulfotransferase, partial [Acidimicrobiales bacterium]|nr:sulfotransferase [Acidimicrobiales bacterium]
HPAPGGPSPEELQAQAQRWLDAFYRLVPGFRAIHGATPTGPEECDALLQNTFASQHFDDMFDAPEYSAWLSQAPLADEYAHYALQLRVLGGAGRWALKSPSHLGHLDALAGALPGATVVVCHRHPQEAIASYASLIHTLRRAYSDHVSPAVVGHQALTRAATAMRRARAVRDRLHVIDVDYRELVRDPLATVQAIYRAMDRALDPAVEASVAAWAAQHPQHEHGPHRYDLATFGLNGEEVDAAFGDYVDRFA